MYEEYHYKGYFNFFFYPTNQSKIVKKYLKEIFPSEAIRLSRKVSKKSNNFDPYKFLDDNRSLLLGPLEYYKTELLIEHLQETYEKQPEVIAIFYLILDDILKSVRFPSDFNIEK